MCQSNPFWIDIQTGEIKYTDYEVCLNPDEDAIVVASSFKDFCKCIRKNQFRNWGKVKFFHLCGWNTLGSKMYIYPIYAWYIA